MLYNLYELQRAYFTSASTMASMGAEALTNPYNPLSHVGIGRVAASALDVFAHAAAPRGKPPFGIQHVNVDGRDYPVTECIVETKPFGSLLRFSHPGLPANAPSLLIVAPMSGHYATLLRGTVERMLERAVVYITDWADAKMVPLNEGKFDLDTYIDYVIAFLEFIGPGTHVMAVCQPSVPSLAATAIMGAANHPCRPASLTMMGGPIDTRASPTAVNTLANEHPLAWFRDNVIATVPMHYPGGGRRVYPGFLQLASFMSMNLGNHLMSHYEMFKHLVAGETDSVAATKSFYDEYRAVCDMTAEFYLQTVDHVFQKYSLPKGELLHHGKPVDLRKITDTAILAVEGERDDISGLGQTKAALDLTSNLPESKKKYFMVPKVGHYGIFNGSRWRTQIAPVVEEWMRANSTHGLKAVAA